MLGRPALPRTLAACSRDAVDPRPATRASALREFVAHALHDRSTVVRALEDGLRDGDPAVRAAAAIGLADVHAVESLAALLYAVEDEDSHVRQMALTAIGELGDARASERLRRALADPRPEVRFQAIIAFAQVAPEEALAASVQAIGDEDASVRYVAIRCAEEATLGRKEPLPPLLVACLAGRLGDDAPAVRVVAAVVLARSRDRSGVSLLSDVIHGRLRTPEAEDEAAAIELAGELQLRDALPALQRRAFGVIRLRADPFAWQAMVALARMGDERAERRILSDLKSRSRDRRTMAVAAVGRARLQQARTIVEAMASDPALAEPSAIVLTLEQLNGRDPYDLGEVS